MMVMQPVMLLKRHWPAVTLSQPMQDRIDALEGTRNASTFAGHGPGVWLLYQVLWRRLWGEPGGRNAYDLTLIFLGDRIRKHNIWTVDWEKPGELGVPTSVADLEAYHTVTTVYPLSPVPFETIVPIDDDACRAPA